MTEVQRRAVGVAARRLLELAWSRESRDSQLARQGIQFVARTFASDPEASAGLLRRALEPAHLSAYGYEEAYTLATALASVMSQDAALVRDAYAALFGFEEHSNEVSPMGTSQILAMTSNRRQDYDMAQHALAQMFPAFLKASPREAALALIESIRGYTLHRHRLGFEKYSGGTFEFLGALAQITPDGSCMWDAGGVYQKDNALEMLQTMERFLSDTTIAPAPADVRAALDTLANKNHSAVIWRRLLRAGARCPASLGVQIRELAWATPVLRALDTSTNAGTFIRAIFPLVSHTERERIERAVLTLTNDVTKDPREWAEDQRDRLLGCLPLNLVSTSDARERIAQMQTTGGAPANTSPFAMSGVSWRESSLESRLERSGVDVCADQNQALLTLRQSVSEIAITQELIEQGGAPLARALAQLTLLRDALHNPLLSEVDGSVEENAWGTLVEAVVRIARLDCSCQHAAGQLTLAILLETSAQSAPDHDPQQDVAFDEQPSWGGPAPRIEAAEGLLLLARHGNCLSPEVLGAIDRASRDPNPAVRLQVASRVWLMNETAPTIMWEIVERISASDPSSSVLRWLVNDSLGRLAQIDTPRVMRLVRSIRRRFDSGPGVGELHERCLDILTGWYVWRDVTDARDELLGLASIRPIPVVEAGHICADLRSAFVAEKGPIDPTGSGVRARALALIGAFLAPAMAELRDHCERGATDLEETSREARRHRIRELISFADLVGRELYFATGVFQERNQSSRGEARVTQAQRERLLREAEPLIQVLADVGLPSLAHHLLEMFEGNIAREPRRTFLMVGRILVAGGKGGYQYEPLAEGMFVRLVEQYLAEHRILFQEDETCKTLLLQMLDIFVVAGWPSAQRLSYRLDEIFR